MTPESFAALGARLLLVQRYRLPPIRCIKAGCRPGGTVLDPFSGSGTTGEAARKLGRKYIGIDLNPEYHDLAVKRYAQGVLDFETEEASA